MRQPRLLLTALCGAWVAGCTANMQQGWPKLVNNVVLLKGTADDVPTIAVALLAPVEAVVGSSKVTIVTDYPFGDK